MVDQIVIGEDGSCDVPRSPCAEDPDQPLCRFKDHVDVFQMDAKLAVGPVFARHIGESPVWHGRVRGRVGATAFFVGGFFCVYFRGLRVVSSGERRRRWVLERALSSRPLAGEARVYSLAPWRGKL